MRDYMVALHYLHLQLFFLKPVVRDPLFEKHYHKTNSLEIPPIQFMLTEQCNVCVLFSLEETDHFSLKANLSSSFVR